jgi:hypothetical protein
MLVDAVARNVDRSVRRAVRDWQRDRHAYVTDRERLVQFALEQYEPFMHRMGAAAHAMWSRKTIEAMWDDPGLLVAGAEDEAGVCALYSFALGGEGAECHLNLSVCGGREATTALIWWGVEQLASRGVAWLHMGGGVSQGDAIAQAKLKFPPKVVPFRAAREVYRRERYDELCTQAGVAADAPGFFPPYRR